MSDLTSILTELTESQLFSSKTGFRKHTGRELVEMLYLNILAFRILSVEKTEHDFIHAYARKTKYYNGFDEWHFTNVTDLYLLVYGVTSGNVDVSQSTDGYLNTVKFDQSKFLLWIKAVATGDENLAESYASRFFLTIDQQLRVNNSSYRSIRRLVGNWTEIGHREQKLAITRLLQLMRLKSKSSDLLSHLEHLSRDKKLEIKDGSIGTDDEAMQKSASHQHKLSEDGDGGGAAAPAAAAPMATAAPAAPASDGPSDATTSANIAPLAKPLGSVRRRVG